MAAREAASVRGAAAAKQNLSREREKNYLRLHLQRLEDLNPREIEKEEEEREKYLW